jgi:hypothetical protein
MVSISFIEEHSNRGEAGPTIAYFFCERKSGEVITAVDMLHGILWQTLNQRLECCVHLTARYRELTEEQITGNEGYRWLRSSKILYTG